MAELDATLGRLYGGSSSNVAAVIDSEPKACSGHERWKRREAERSASELVPLVGLCRAAGLPEPVPEYQFHPHRKWRFDYAWPLARLAVEIDGGVWTQGRHTRGAGFLADMEKFNAATLLGWRILRYVPDELHHALPALSDLLGATA